MELIVVINIKKFVRKGKCNIISNKGKSEYLEFLDSDDFDVFFFDEFKGGNVNLGLRCGDL